MTSKKYAAMLKIYAEGLLSGCDMIRCLEEFDGTAATKKALENLIENCDLPSVEELERFIAKRRVKKG